MISNNYNIIYNPSSFSRRRMYKQKLRKVKCGKCDLMIPLKLWREHTLQHTALDTLQLDTYPISFLALTKHYCKSVKYTFPLKLDQDCRTIIYNVSC